MQTAGLLVDWNVGETGVGGEPQATDLAALQWRTFTVCYMPSFGFYPKKFLKSTIPVFTNAKYATAKITPKIKPFFVDHINSASFPRALTIGGHHLPKKIGKTNIPTTIKITKISICSCIISTIKSSLKIIVT
jgi:hypothetical protein